MYDILLPLTDYLSLTEQDEKFSFGEVKGEMLPWYRDKLKEHGLLVATRLLMQVVWARGRTTAANRILPEKVLCPCCGWRGRRFYDYIDVGCVIRDVECPQCNSHSRHRNFYLWLKSDYPLKSKNGIALIFAPEKCLDSVWKQESTHLHSYGVDIEAVRDVDLLADLQKLPFISDSVDFIWCHHVLTQVQDDRAAIAELYRVLRPQTGELILSVATTADPSTREFGYANKELIGFWRIYGQDFASKLNAQGLDVKRVRFEAPPEISKRHGLAPEEDFYICVKPAGS